LGAIIVKAAAADVDDQTDAQLGDLALLLSLLEQPMTERGDLTSKDKRRLRARSELLDARHRAWSTVPASEADRGRAALRLLTG